VYIHASEISDIYGPGERFVIWSQGCSIHCPGCWNKEMWPFKQDKYIIAKEIIDIVCKEKLEGVTILGGEPFDQYDSLFEIVKELNGKDISIILYTGYEKEALVEKNNIAIFNYIDMLISGKYDEKFRDINKQLIGSTNQQIDFMSNRYNEKIIQNGNYVEIIFETDGSTKMIGFPEENMKLSVFEKYSN